MDTLIIFFGTLIGGLFFGYWLSYKKGKASWRTAILGFTGWCIMVAGMLYPICNKINNPIKDSCKKEIQMNCTKQALK